MNDNDCRTTVVRRERDDRTLIIRLHRPAKRNAFDAAMTAELDCALNEFEDDPELRVAILTGGDEMFSAGTDLSTGPGERTARGGEYGVIRRRRRKPLIAAVDGHALGGGMEIVLACDLVVAARTATFALPEPRRGVIATCGGLFRTQRALPLNVAKELLLTGEPLGAERGWHLGFVNVLTAPGDALDGALEVAERICRNAPVSVRESLTALERVNSADDDAAWQITHDAMTTALASQDAIEGITAFFERREPRWAHR
ncbi:enoyl-CoA hydratase-related protein [Nocardia sp. NPDC060256]|uniref:enoyl-CoA hydratase-related protein n=1 Tax=unclassified Nocardia TaxID=2637762 RepID=UPI003653671B